MPPITSDPVNVSETVGCAVKPVAADVGSVSPVVDGASNNLISRRSRGAGAMEPPAVPKRECVVSRRFWEIGESRSSPPAACRFDAVRWPVVWSRFSLPSTGNPFTSPDIYSSAETVFDGRGSNGLPSTAASAKILNAPFAAVVLPGPRSASNVGKFFAASAVALSVYRSCGRDRAFGTASRTKRCKLRGSVATELVDGVALEPVAVDTEVYMKGQLSGKAT